MISDMFKKDDVNNEIKMSTFAQKVPRQKSHAFCIWSRFNRWLAVTKLEFVMLRTCSVIAGHTCHDIM